MWKRWNVTLAAPSQGNSDWTSVWTELDVPEGNKSGKNLQKQMGKVHRWCPCGLHQVTTTSWDQNWSHLIFTSVLTCFVLPFPISIFNCRTKGESTMKPWSSKHADLFLLLRFVWKPKNCHEDEMGKEILSSNVYSWSWQAENGNVSVVFLSLECQLFKARTVATAKLTFVLLTEGSSKQHPLCSWGNWGPFVGSHGSNNHNNLGGICVLLFLGKSWKINSK